MAWDISFNLAVKYDDDPVIIYLSHAMLNKIALISTFFGVG
jgi:hypothetical protein